MKGLQELPPSLREHGRAQPSPLGNGASPDTKCASTFILTSQPLQLRGANVSSLYAPSLCILS